MLKYKPLLDDKIDISQDDKDTLAVFQEVIKKENDSVTERMRENIGGSNVGSEFIDITPSDD